jgi:tetratricopeptide (TPR) repeat protein
MRATVLGLALALAAATGAHAQPADNVERARVLYLAAQTALDEGRYEDALRDFGAVYDLTHDAVLLYKLGRAYEGAKRCETAIVYYQRYLKEGQPDAEHVKLADERIAACTPPSPTEPPPDPTPPEAPTEPAVAVPPAAPPKAPVTNRYAGPWLMVGGAIAGVTLGAVLAYSAEAVESDVEDLYVGAGGLPPDFDADTAQQLSDLRDEGRRYEVLSWVSFGVGLGLAGGAAVWYLLAKDETPPPVLVAPTANGAAATIRF